MFFSSFLLGGSCGCQGVMGAREGNAKCRIQSEAKARGSGSAPQKSETENADLTFLNIDSD
eukprot:3088884-Prymnesium_polylepis.1